MVQYTLWGILLKPCSGPSMRYIKVPKSIEMTKTKNTNTKILVLLDFKAFIRLLDSPTKRTSFRILNTRNSLKALNAVKYWEPANNMDKYFGTVDNKSIMPKKLKIYFVGLFIHMILRIYSMVKRMVTTHSEIFKNLWCFISKVGTLSNITIMILYSMSISRIMSKSFPDGVWVPYIIIWSFLLQPILGLWSFNLYYLIQ